MKPYDKSRLEREKAVKDNFGLRRKKEIWRAESILRNFRQRARALQANRNEKDEARLLETMRNMGIKCDNLENILEVGLDDILSRRLQSIVHKKGLANTMKQSRQFVVHGHVMVGDRKVMYPSYIVSGDEDDKITMDQKIKLKSEEKKDA